MIFNNYECNSLIFHPIFGQPFEVLVLGFIRFSGYFLHFWAKDLAEYNTIKNEKQAASNLKKGRIKQSIGNKIKKEFL